MVLASDASSMVEELGEPKNDECGNAKSLAGVAEEAKAPSQGMY